MGFYPVAVYYNKTQHTNNTPHSNKHSTQNYTNNKGHTISSAYLSSDNSNRHFFVYTVNSVTAYNKFKFI
jgi:hypothetical protein